jgi:hypothetical protein
MCEITIRCEGGEFLTITLWGRSHSPATDFWDGNWISAMVKVQAGGFRGSVGGDLRAEELVDFLKHLVLLQEALRGTAQFFTMEGWLSIRVEGDGRGHMKCECTLLDEPGIGNRLEFTLNTDQTFTRSTVDELTAAVHEFPVLGAP